jgi:hypothetical protein
MKSNKLPRDRLIGETYIQKIIAVKIIGSVANDIF